MSPLVRAAAFFVTMFSVQAYALQDGAKVYYEYRYDSDSGYVDINECVRRTYVGGTLMDTETVHDWVSNRSEPNVFCQGVARGERMKGHYEYTTDFDSGHTDELCSLVRDGIRKTVSLAYCKG